MKWIIQANATPHAKLNLFCFPYAGGGASTYRTWTNVLGSDVNIYAIQLPGHENRFRERPFTSWQPVIDEVKQEISPLLDKPFALFGYSLGAILAYELAHVVQTEYGKTPEALFVAARVAPTVKDKRDPPMHQLPDAAFVEQLSKFDGTPQRILQDKEFMELVLPVLRADFQINENYLYTNHQPLTCQISAFRGAQDDLMTYEDVTEWQKETTGQFTLRTLPNGHFFIHNAKDLFLQVLQHDIRKVLRTLR